MGRDLDQTGLDALSPLVPLEFRALGGERIFVTLATIPFCIRGVLICVGMSQELDPKCASLLRILGLV